MNKTLEPARLSGTIHIPPSKSITQRALAAALLHKGRTIIRRAGHSADELAALEIIRSGGAAVISSGEVLEINSQGLQPVNNIISCGESGLAARLFVPILALAGEELMIEAEGSLRQRPMQLFEAVLPQLGVSVHSREGHLPLCIKGPLHASDLTVDGSLSSQFITGLLFAFTEAAEEPVTLRVHQPVSLPYLDLTLDMLQKAGKPVSRNDDYTEFRIDPARFHPADPLSLQVESDWSSAAVWIAAACFAHPITLRGLEPGSLQADRALLYAVQQTGAVATWREEGLCIAAPAALLPFHFDATHCPDLFPVLSILAAGCTGHSSIRGLHRLQHKESDRAHSVMTLLQQLGVPCSRQDDVLHITGVPSFRPAEIDSFNDHRIVMAAALAATRCDGPLTILGAEAVGKSYPDFFLHWEQAGSHVKTW